MKKLTLAVLIAIVALVLGGSAMAEDINATKLMNILSTNKNLTRADFVFMLVKAAALEPEYTSFQFPLDVSKDSWYADPIKITLQKSIIKGYSDGTIRPEQEITQLEASTLIVRTIGLPDNAAAPDVYAASLPLSNTHWGYNVLSWVVSEGFLTDPDPNGNLTREESAVLLDKVFGTNQKARDFSKLAEQAQKSIKTMRISGTMDIKMKFNSETYGQADAPTEIRTVAGMTGELSMDQGMHQRIDYNLPVAGVPQSFTMEQYLTEGGMFIKMSNPQTGEAMWTKMPQKMFPKMSDIIKQQSNPITPETEKMFFYRYLGEDNYATKIAFYGKIDDFNKFMNMFSGQGLSPQGMQDMSKQVNGLIKSTSIKGTMLINKKTNLPESTKLFATVVFNKDNSQKGFAVESMIADYDCSYTDYDSSSISVTLPKEALSAKEIPITSQGIK